MSVWSFAKLKLWHRTKYYWQHRRGAPVVLLPQLLLLNKATPVVPIR